MQDLTKDFHTCGTECTCAQEVLKFTNGCFLALKTILCCSFIKIQARSLLKLLVFVALQPLKTVNTANTHTHTHTVSLQYPSCGYASRHNDNWLTGHQLIATSYLSVMQPRFQVTSGLESRLPVTLQCSIMNIHEFFLLAFLCLQDESSLQNMLLYEYQCYC